MKVKQTVGIKRLIFVSSMGIYDEVPGERCGSIIEPYRKAPSIIETSGLDYTILRPAWLDLGSPSLISIGVGHADLPGIRLTDKDLSMAALSRAKMTTEFRDRAYVITDCIHLNKLER